MFKDDTDYAQLEYEEQVVAGFLFRAHGAAANPCPNVGKRIS